MGDNIYQTTNQFLWWKTIHEGDYLLSATSHTWAAICKCSWFATLTLRHWVKSLNVITWDAASLMRFPVDSTHWAFLFTKLRHTFSCSTELHKWNIIWQNLPLPQEKQHCYRRDGCRVLSCAPCTNKHEVNWMSLWSPCLTFKHCFLIS